MQIGTNPEELFADVISYNKSTLTCGEEVPVDGPPITLVISSVVSQLAVAPAIAHAACRDQTQAPDEVVVVLGSIPEADAHKYAALFWPCRGILVSSASKIVGGQSRNLGAEQATHVLTTFLDGDDIAMPTWFQIVRYMYAQSSFTMMVHTWAMGGNRPKSCKTLLSNSRHVTALEAFKKLTGTARRSMCLSKREIAEIRVGVLSPQITIQRWGTSFGHPEKLIGHDAWGFEWQGQALAYPHLSIARFKKLKLRAHGQELSLRYRLLGGAEDLYYVRVSETAPC